MMKKNAVREQLYRLEFDRRRRLQPLFAQLGLTPGQPRILSCLLEHGVGLTQRELADRCYLDATTLSRALDRLEEGGLVARSASGASRRAKRITLTPLGETKAAAVAENLARMDEALSQGFAPEELARLLDGLERLQKNLEGMEAD
jgi:DNA-binding MarR family transcriptional regulator